MNYTIKSLDNPSQEQLNLISKKLVHHNQSKFGLYDKPKFAICAYDDGAFIEKDLMRLWQTQ